LKVSELGRVDARVAEGVAAVVFAAALAGTVIAAWEFGIGWLTINTPRKVTILPPGS